MPKVSEAVTALKAATAAILMAAAVVHGGCMPCDRPALPRDEALRQAHLYLDQMADDIDFGKSGPVLAKEELDPKTKVWSFEFRAGDCVVLIGTDDCNGTDVSGLNAACKSK